LRQAAVRWAAEADVARFGLGLAGAVFAALKRAGVRWQSLGGREPLAIAVLQTLDAAGARAVLQLAAGAGVGAGILQTASVGRAAQPVVAVLVAHTADAASLRIADLTLGAQPRLRLVGAAGWAANVGRARDVVVALLVAAADGAAGLAALGASRGAVVELADSALAPQVGLAGRARHAISDARALGGRDAAAVVGIADVARLFAIDRGARAMPARALVDRAAMVIVAVGHGAAGTARSALAVGAGAALLAASAQLPDAAFTVDARADGAGILIGVALGVAAAITGARRSRASQVARATQLRAVVVAAEVIGSAGVGGTPVVVVANRHRVFAGEDAARLPRTTAVFARAELTGFTIGVFGHVHALAHEAGVLGAAHPVVAVVVFAAVGALAPAALLRPLAFLGKVAGAVGAAGIGGADVVIVAVFRPVTRLAGGRPYPTLGLAFTRHAARLARGSRPSCRELHGRERVSGTTAAQERGTEGAAERQEQIFRLEKAHGEGSS